MGLLILSCRNLFSRFRTGLDAPRPELPLGLDDPPPRPLPPFLLSLIMSSRDIFILSAIARVYLVETQKVHKELREPGNSFSLRWRGDVETSGTNAGRRSDDYGHGEERRYFRKNGGPVLSSALVPTFEPKAALNTHFFSKQITILAVTYTKK